ncbi:hypothetical protein [Pelosinus propionicus]|uniref:Uncharacterized protein n=1 Tax=Pelosinus propionicus DSM 13327 TaxID=1123291 RepID=A0A1I4N8I5_9FIRM|nr:hypothetical protein [Pelosinus propionicus]SFM11607.1 hypothetical protein SAMN04490355_104218 [Pelosinus propionicus DSM 13327]
MDRVLFLFESIFSIFIVFNIGLILFILRTEFTSDDVITLHRYGIKYKDTISGAEVSIKERLRYFYLQAKYYYDPRTWEISTWIYFSCLVIVLLCGANRENW